MHHLKHPADAFALHLRAYIDTIVGTLRCSMDYQTTDGVAMLLKYVTSYVTKWQESTDIAGLYSYKVQGGQAAIRHLMQNKPAEPEMWLLMSAKKIAWSCSRTKRYNVPTSETIADDKVALRYWGRPKKLEHLNFLEWLRMVDHTKVNPKQYTHGSTLVGTKMLSIYNREHFFQYTLMHLAHRDITCTYHPNHTNIPDSLKWHAQVVFHFPELWGNHENLKTHLSTFGHKTNYVTTVLYYIQSLEDLLYMHRMSLISLSQLQIDQPQPVNPFPLDPQQRSIKQHIMASVSLRQEHYYNYNSEFLTDEDDSDADEENEDDREMAPSLPSVNNQLEILWEKPILITGKPGSGKSQVMHVVSQISKNDVKVLIASPTGFLSSVSRAKTPDEIICETVHSAFHLPIHSDTAPTINWELSQLDLLVIDEISMVSQENFKHILNTLSKLLFRPVLVICGDSAQQQPFTKTAKGSKTLNNPLHDQRFVSSTYHYNLTSQHRVGDHDFLNFLDQIRNWVPTNAILENIQKGRVLCPDGIVSISKVISQFEQHPNTTVLTYTNQAANFINSSVAEKLSENCKPLASLKLDDNYEQTNIYQNMRIMVTQNRDKSRNVVNGQMATVYACKTTP